MAGERRCPASPLVPDLFERGSKDCAPSTATPCSLHGGRRRSTSSVLYDAGLGRDTAVHNLDVLDVPIGDLRAIVLSHGHAIITPVSRGSFAGGVGPGSRSCSTPMPGASAASCSRPEVSCGLPPPSRADLEAEGVEVVEERGPSLLLGRHGPRERVRPSRDHVLRTRFSRAAGPVTVRGGGSPIRGCGTTQSVIVDVRGLGLVVLSSCSHPAPSTSFAMHCRPRPRQGATPLWEGCTFRG